jgi:hypothetical protein
MNCAKTLQVETMSADMNSAAMAGRIITFKDAMKLHLDIVVEEGMQLSRTQLTMLQGDDTKVAAFRTGNDYIFLTEQILFRSVLAAHKKEKAHTTLFETTGYDQVWCIPSFCKHKGFLTTLLRSPTVEAPYVWSGFFFDGTTRLLKERQAYTNRGKDKVIAMFEPNLNVVKTSTVPIYIAESLYRREPNLVHKVIVTNAADLIVRYRSAPSELLVIPLSLSPPPYISLAHTHAYLLLSLSLSLIPPLSLMVRLRCIVRCIAVRCRTCCAVNCYRRASLHRKSLSSLPARWICSMPGRSRSKDGTVLYFA